MWGQPSLGPGGEGPVRQGRAGLVAASPPTRRGRTLPRSSHCPAAPPPPPRPRPAPWMLPWGGAGGGAGDRPGARKAVTQVLRGAGAGAARTARRRTTTRTKTRTAGPAAGPGPPATPAPAASLRVRSVQRGRGRGPAVCLWLTAYCPQAPAGQLLLTQCLRMARPAPRTAGTGSPTGSIRTSRPRARLALRPPAPCSSGEARSRAGGLGRQRQAQSPLRPLLLPARSQDPAPHSAPQEATDGSKAAEPAGETSRLSPGARPACPTSAPVPGLSTHSEEGAGARLPESHCRPLSSAQPPARPCSASGTSRPASEGRAPPLAPWTGTDCWGSLESKPLGRQGAGPRLSPFTGPWSTELPLSPGVGGLGRIREGRGWALTCSSSGCWAAPRGPGM